MIPEAAVEAAAKAIYGNRVREWTLAEELTCTSQARRALEAAAPHMLAEAWDGAALTIRDDMEVGQRLFVARRILDANPYRRAQ